MIKSNVTLSIEFRLEGCNLDTKEPTWNVEAHFGGLKLIDTKYYGKSELKALAYAKGFLKDIEGES